LASSLKAGPDEEIEGEFHEIAQWELRVTNVLDGLIGRIEEPALREELTLEVQRLRSSKDFGLVFERHLPEEVRLYSYPLRRGCVVCDRSGEDPTHWTVLSVSGGRAKLVSAGKGESERSVSEL